MSHDDLIAFKKSISEKMATTELQKSFLFDASLDYTISWSKDPACSIIPLDLEMSGVTPAGLSVDEPKNKKNFYENYFLGTTLVK
ncbi:hypothetical protein [Pseudomonas syringae]|uniref:hypothetical protein n=1 Tax=Pseudomonas syringae TaxID=317 RepID=UPI000B20BE68|nr:hypothetical protein [Pseudomonas syringae]